VVVVGGGVVDELHSKRTAMTLHTEEMAVSSYSDLNFISAAANEIAAESNTPRNDQPIVVESAVSPCRTVKRRLPLHHEIATISDSLLHTGEGTDKTLGRPHSSDCAQMNSPNNEMGENCMLNEANQIDEVLNGASIEHIGKVFTSASEGLSPIRRRSHTFEEELSDPELDEYSFRMPAYLTDDDDVRQYINRTEKIASSDEDFLPTYQPRLSLFYTAIEEGDEEAGSELDNVELANFSPSSNQRSLRGGLLQDSDHVHYSDQFNNSTSVNVAPASGAPASPTVTHFSNVHGVLQSPYHATQYADSDSRFVVPSFVDDVPLCDESQTSLKVDRGCDSQDSCDLRVRTQKGLDSPGGRWVLITHEDDGRMDASDLSTTSSTVTIDSMGHASVPKTDQLLPTSEELGASSMAFIRQLRGAAFRRKMNLSRSRDSLAAKERKQLEEVAASEKDATGDDEVGSVVANIQRRESLTSNEVSADTIKVLPTTVYVRNDDATAGLPHVKHRPTTIPISPALGRRRYLRMQPDHAIEAQGQMTLPSDLPEGPSDAMASRPLRNVHINHESMVGVPKVDKRPRTAPISPCLASRRRLGNKTNDKAGIPRSNSLLSERGLFLGQQRGQTRPTTTPISPYLGPRRRLNPRLDHDNEKPSSSFKALIVPRSTGRLGRAGLLKGSTRKATIPQSPLLGARRPKPLPPATVRREIAPEVSIDLSEDSKVEDFGILSRKENVTANLRNVVNSEGFIPRSTDRAAKRAEFEIQRQMHEQERKERERKERQQKVEAIRKELGILRMSI
jgi:hypothetical protein